MDLEVEEMLNNEKFDICIPLHNGKWLPSLDLVCGVEDCFQCEYSVVYGVLGIDRECKYSTISENRITSHLLKQHPKKVLRLIKDMQLPENVVKYWQKEIQKKYSINEYPELWV